jgi:hypothetical protein
MWSVCAARFGRILLQNCRWRRRRRCNLPGGRERNRQSTWPHSRNSLTVALAGPVESVARSARYAPQIPIHQLRSWCVESAPGANGLRFARWQRRRGARRKRRTRPPRRRASMKVKVMAKARGIRSSRAKYRNAITATIIPAVRTFDLGDTRGLIIIERSFPPWLPNHGDPEGGSNRNGKHIRGQTRRHGQGRIVSESRPKPGTSILLPAPHGRSYQRCKFPNVDASHLCEIKPWSFLPRDGTDSPLVGAGTRMAVDASLH